MEYLLGLVKEEEKKENIQPSRVMLGGFSQVISFYLKGEYHETIVLSEEKGEHQAQQGHARRIPTGILILKGEYHETIVLRRRRTSSPAGSCSEVSHRYSHFKGRVSRDNSYVRRIGKT